ncbi:heme A synthase [Caldibacillus lycopersici]|uniref:Heme A synthase n=1 Tax=Perspicuibacillus lycopersici TaxID=1325689 RepID=A0AAE3LM13_9BACI|nr:heme A synthase [Perspicuibacillus lycopersici]MCU9612237.1 heme A synthase [Perspicuibacillus lycopersici]
MQPYLKRLAVLSTFGMLMLLIGGALVTKTDSGDGCGASWPLCNGQFIPSEITSELVIEASHRMVTGLVAIMVLVLAILSWKKLGHIRETKFLSILALSFIVIQSLVGAATVLWGQSDFFMALHFGISLISFSAVLLLTLLIFEIDKKFQVENVIIDKRMKAHTIGLTIYSLVVIYTGALVRHMEASMICSDWPFCNNTAITLPRNIYEWVQMGHRLAAGLIFLWILFIFLLAIRKYKTQPVIYYGWMIAFILVSLQVFSGAIVIISQLNLYVALLHALFISCLFGVLSYMIFIISRTQYNERARKLHSKKHQENKEIISSIVQNNG